MPGNALAPKDNLVDPRRFIGQQMTLRRTRPAVDDDYLVEIAGHVAARILLVVRANSKKGWAWLITGPSMPREMYQYGGVAQSLDEANIAVRQRFDAWLAWALQREGLAIWHYPNP